MSTQMFMFMFTMFSCFGCCHGMPLSLPCCHSNQFPPMKLASHLTHVAIPTVPFRSTFFPKQSLSLCNSLQLIAYFGGCHTQRHTSFVAFIPQKLRRAALVLRMRPLSPTLKTQLTVRNEVIRAKRKQKKKKKN